MITHTQAEILALHHRLLKELGLPRMGIGFGMSAKWSTFLLEMEPLVDSDQGKLNPDDMTRLVARMKAFNAKSRDAKFTLQLAKILSNPERCFDMVCEERKKLTLRHRQPVREVETARADGSRILAEEQQAHDDGKFKRAAESFKAEVAKLRKEIRG